MRIWFAIVNYISPIKPRIAAAVDTALQTLGQHCNNMHVDPRRVGIDYKVDQTFKTETNKRITTLASAAFFTPYLELHFCLSRQDYDQLVQQEWNLKKAQIASFLPERQKQWNKNLKEQAVSHVLKRLVELSKTTEPELVGNRYLIEAGLRPRFTQTNGVHNIYELLKNTYTDKEILSLLWFTKEKHPQPAANTLTERLEWIRTLNVDQAKSLLRFLSRMEKIFGCSLWDAKEKAGRLLSQNTEEREIFAFVTALYQVYEMREVGPALRNKELQTLRELIPVLPKLLQDCLNQGRFIEIANDYGKKKFLALMQNPGAMKPQRLQRLDATLARKLKENERTGTRPFYDRDHKRFSGNMFIGNSGPFTNPQDDPKFDEMPPDVQARVLAENRDAMNEALLSLDPALLQVSDFAASIEFEQDAKSWVTYAWSENGLTSPLFRPIQTEIQAKKIQKIPQGLRVDFDIEFQLCSGLEKNKLPLISHRTKVRVDLTNGDGDLNWHQNWTWNPAAAIPGEAVAAVELPKAVAIAARLAQEAVAAS